MCYEDLQPHVHIVGDELSSWTSYLESQSSSSVRHLAFFVRQDPDLLSPHQSSCDVLNRFINAQALLRYNLLESEVTVESEAARALQYLRVYLDALHLGKDLPDTELQPADDLALLSGQAFVSAWRTGRDAVHLYNAVAVLECASSRSKHSYKIRLLLIRIYRLLGMYLVATNSVGSSVC